MARFMIGRYGMDQLSKMVNYISFALLILTLFTHSMLLYILAVAGIIYSYYRAFSRNISKRYSENQAYLKVKYDVLKPGLAMVSANNAFVLGRNAAASSSSVASGLTRVHSTPILGIVTVKRFVVPP